MAVGTTVEVTLPRMGESVSEGTVLEWHAAVGDQVTADQTLVEVSTDKVDAEVPAPASGTLVRIHAQEGDTVAEDETVVEISTDKVDAEVPAPAAGTITEVLAAAGDTVEVGQVLARMTTTNGAPAKATEAATPER